MAARQKDLRRQGFRAVDVWWIKSTRPMADARRPGKTVAQFFNDILHRLISSVGHDSWIGYALAAGVHLFLLINVVAVGALVFIWMERKIAGRIQDRLGPTRVGGKF